MHFRGLKMNSRHATTVGAARISRTAIIALASAFVLFTITGCFGSPRANDTFAGAAIGAGAGALLAGSEGSPATGALVGGLGGGAVGYLVGTEMQNNGYYGPYGYNGGY
jgi:hypothetical protein